VGFPIPDLPIFETHPANTLDFLFTFCSHSIGSRRSTGARYGVHFRQFGNAKKLRDGGVPQDQAEAHAEAARDFIMVELATKADVLAIKSDLLATEQRLQASVRELDTKIDTQTLRLTVRLGAMQVVLIGAFAALLKLG
jgi:hypothetical protein